MESSWLVAFKRLHALAVNGLEFTESHYEQDRYQEIKTIVESLLSELTELPVASITEKLAHPEGGYQTPKIDVRAVLIQNNKILLVQEKTDQRWALPGGYADVGISAAENAEKEMWEEAGLKVKAQKLYAVIHKAKGNYKPDIRDFYKFYFLCEQVGTEKVAAGSEVLDAGFFAMNSLPELSAGRTNIEGLERAFEHLNDPSLPTHFD